VRGKRNLVMNPPQKPQPPPYTPFTPPSQPAAAAAWARGGRGGIGGGLRGKRNLVNPPAPKSPRPPFNPFSDLPLGLLLLLGREEGEEESEGGAREEVPCHEQVLAPQQGVRVTAHDARPDK
jgi:hypothetical protein